VLANDSDPDGDPLTVTGVTDPPNGTATINPDNTVTSRPEYGFLGTDTFTYTIHDGQGSTDTGVVTVRVRKTSRRDQSPAVRYNKRIPGLLALMQNCTTTPPRRRCSPRRSGEGSAR
jgi:Bacterial Ig domain